MSVALSIIIPSYNRLWALPKAIESCRATKAAHEIIVVDDGSSDGTSEWLARQPGLVSLRSDNWGKDWAVNRAFAIARGEYVRFLDSDDWLEPDANDGELEVARATGADVVVAGYRTYEEKTDRWVEAPWEASDDFIAQQLGEWQPGHYSAFLFKRSFVADVPHRQEYTPEDDRMFMLEVALKHPRIAVWDKFAFVHFHHGRGRLQVQVSIDQIVQHAATLRVHRKILALLQARGELTDRRRRAPTRSRLWPLAHDMARYDRRAASDVVRMIHELHPGFEVPGTGMVATLYRKLGFERAATVLGWRRALLRTLGAS
jgi:glycosyltransferase involved in cell wall biosynthesis